MGAIRLLNKQAIDNKTQILHIERDSKQTCIVEILDREGNQVAHVGLTTLSNLKKAGYKVELETFAERVERLIPHITDESFKRGLKANYERMSKSEEKKKVERSEAAQMKQLLAQMEKMSAEDIYEKLGVF